MTISEGRLLAKYTGFPPFAFDPERACRNVANKNLFFPENQAGRKTSDEAKAICERCPLKHECAEWAIKAPEDHGVWGALTANDRRKIRKRRGGAAAA